MEVKNINIAYEAYAGIDELSAQDKQLCLEAVKAMESSYSPYSKFRVGAAVLLSNKQVVRGSNQENAAYPSGLCAERVALFAAGANFPEEEILTIAVTASTQEFQLLRPVTSCGPCLQVMAEYEQKQNKPIEVLLYCINGEVWKVKGVNSFLPMMFFEKRLGKG